ncbi:MAG: hypothetical protein V3U54_12750 [Thermodesulfobacteriota bacterium]
MTYIPDEILYRNLTADPASTTKFEILPPRVPGSFLGLLLWLDENNQQGIKNNKLEVTKEKIYCRYCKQVTGNCDCEAGIKNYIQPSITANPKCPDCKDPLINGESADLYCPNFGCFHFYERRHAKCTFNKPCRSCAAELEINPIIL